MKIKSYLKNTMRLLMKVSNECGIFHYWCFKDIGFKYEPYFCNGCHDLMQKAMSFNNTAIIYVKEMLMELIFGI